MFFFSESFTLEVMIVLVIDEKVVDCLVIMSRLPLREGAERMLLYLLKEGKTEAVERLLKNPKNLVRVGTSL